MEERKAVCDVLIVEKCETKKIKNSLEQTGIFNKKFRISQTDDSKFAIPIHKDKYEADKIKTQIASNKSIIVSQLLMSFSKSHMIKLESVQKSVTEALLDLFYMKTGKSLEEEYLKDIPKSWQIYDDMLVLPKDTMVKEVWGEIAPDVWDIFCKKFDVKRIARHSIIVDDAFRSSKVELLFGDNGWVKRKDNGIIYEYDITKCMFSDGNITEKLRIAKLDCSDEIVVDLFAGIGYFVLPFLVHANAKLVYACEWNPTALEALKRNLHINGVHERCIILEGDNRKVAPKGVADRVNLGLIPSSEASWYTACESLKPLTGGWLHIHANVNSLDFKAKKSDGESRFNCNKISESESEITVSKRSDQSGMNLAAQSSAADNVCLKDAKLGRDLCEIFSNNSRTDNHKELHSKDLNRSSFDAGCKREYWNKWAETQAITIKEMLDGMHGNAGNIWQCDVRHIEHVKSYAPYIDHIVVDMECRPVSMP